MTDKSVRAWSDSDPYLPTVHLDAAEPGQGSPDAAEFGFTFADEWEGGKRKRSLDDEPSDRYNGATHKRDNLPPSDDAPPGSIIRRSPPHKRDISVDPSSLLDHPIDRLSLATLPAESSSDGRSKGWFFKDAPHRKRQESEAEVVDGDGHPSEPGWIFKDAPHRKRQETVTEVVDDIGQPVEPVIESTSGTKYPRPRAGWLWASAPHKRDEDSSPCFNTHDSSLIFKDAPINCSRGIWARVKKAVRSILP